MLMFRVSPCSGPNPMALAGDRPRAPRRGPDIVHVGRESPFFAQLALSLSIAGQFATLFGIYEIVFQDSYAATSRHGRDRARDELVLVFSAQPPASHDVDALRLRGVGDRDPLCVGK